MKPRHVVGCLQLLDDGASKVGRLVVAAHVRRPVSAQERIRPALGSQSSSFRPVRSNKSPSRGASRYIIQRGDVPDLALGEDVVRRLCDRISVEVETEVPQELSHTRHHLVSQSNTNPPPEADIHSPRAEDGTRRSPWWRRGPWRRDLRRPGPGCPWRRDGCARARASRKAVLKTSATATTPTCTPSSVIHQGRNRRGREKERG